MLGSTVLEVAVGLTFCYATLALIVSTVQEALASALRLRAHTLLDGIKSMLNDPQFTGLARMLYSHALVLAQVEAVLHRTDPLRHRVGRFHPERAGQLRPARADHQSARQWRRCPEG